MFDPRLVLTLAMGILLLLNGLTSGRPVTMDGPSSAEDVDNAAPPPEAPQA